jgi:hypothetical protein
MSENAFASVKLAQNNTMSLEEFRARKVALVTGKKLSPFSPSFPPCPFFFFVISILERKEGGVGWLIRL